MKTALQKIRKSPRAASLRTESKPQKVEKNFIAELRRIVESSRSRAYAAINFAQVEANWLIGQRIVEQEQYGKKRAEYGARIIELASQELTAEFGNGFSERNLRKYRQFYVLFNESPIWPTLSAKSSEIAIFPNKTTSIVQTPSAQLANFPKHLALLPWSHYERLMRVENPDAREWYMREAAEESWSYRTLDRNVNTQFYERLLSSQAKDPVIAEMRKKTRAFQADKLAFIRNPSVMEFLGLPPNAAVTEAELEKAVITNIQQFLIELGKGFAFVARQKHIRTESEDYFIDLVFYNHKLKCFVLVDLKIGKVSHQDVGQMDMYVRMFDERERGDDDNPTLGIILCSETDHDIARYSVLKGSEQLFATKYKLYLPTNDELRAEIERQKELLRLQFGGKNEA